MRKQIAELRLLQAQKQTVQTKDQTVTIEPTERVKETIENIQQEIQQAGLDELENLNKKLSELSAKIARYRTYLEYQVEINGQKKSVQHWLEEYTRLKGKKGEDSVRGEQEILQDLGEARLLLDYFSEKEQSARKQRSIDKDMVEPVAFEEVEALNPQLAKVLSGINDEGGRKSMLKVLQVIFGIDRILPTAKDDEKAVDLAHFLTNNWEKLKEIQEVDAFNQQVETIRQQVLKGKKPDDNGNTNQPENTI